MLDNKVAIITGAGKGIGKAIALSMAKQGVRIAVVDINNFSEATDEIRQEGGEAAGFKVDISKVSEIKSMVQEVYNKYGQIDILVNNVGINPTTALEDITEEEWDRTMAVNLKSSFFSSQSVCGYMQKQKWGRIINIASLAGRSGSLIAGCHYGASKAGMIGLTKSLARVLGPYNITVNAVAPGTIKTDMIKDYREETMAQFISNVPLRKVGRTENIAEVVAFLASDAADFITGATIDVNGGMYMG